SRAIELLRPSGGESIPSKATSIPLVGRVAAGLPVLAEENVEDYLTVPDEIAKKGTLYALRIAGESMVDAGIHNGDIAIIQKKEVARNGEIIVALIDNEATLKVFYKESDHIRLEPRNSKFKPIKTKKVSVIGKLVGLYRIY
ncbi:MAG: repressor LexA, partial [Leptospiraceae bacterium]|nr:repressor LexA [Leptospiraceae bacterium]